MSVTFIGGSFGESSGAFKRAKALSKENVTVNIYFYYSSRYLFKKNGLIDNEESDILYFKEIELIKNSISGDVRLIGADSPFSIRAAIHLFKILKESRPAAVFCHHSFISALGAILSRLSGVKKVYILEMSDIKRKSTVLRIFTSIAYLFSKNIISISVATQNSMGFIEKITSFKKKISIYNGVDIDRIINRDQSIDSYLLRQYGLSKDGYIYYAGRFVEVKNISLLIDAFRNLKSFPGFEDVKLVLSGSGPETLHIQEMVQRYNLGRDIIFTGNVPYDHVLSLMSSASVYTMCSFSEGFSESIVQAMTLGKVIVATNNPSFTEALSPDRGILTEFDSCKYSAQLSKAILDISLRSRLSLNAKAATKEYAISNIINSYKKLI